MSANFHNIVLEGIAARGAAEFTLLTEVCLGMSEMDQQVSQVVRVILVGRTGLDQVVATQHGFELNSVGTPLEAIAALSFPPDRKIVPTSVVLSQEVLHELIEVSHSTSQKAGERLGELVECLRSFGSYVRVVGSFIDRSQPFSVLFDGTVRRDMTDEVIRSVVRGSLETAAARERDMLDRVKPVAKSFDPAHTEVSGAKPLIGRSSTGPGGDSTKIPSSAPMHEGIASGKAPPPLPRAEEVPLIDAVRGETGVRQAGLGDSALVSLLLRGQDLLPQAIALIRERCVDSTIEFVPAKAATAEPTEGNRGGGAASHCRVPVTWDGHEVGSLCSSRTLEATIARHAKWLGSWLKLGEQQAQLREAAFKDHLTGAWNRRYFDRFLASTVDHARARRQNLTVMVFDIDNFKKYNDRFGHEAGDEILVEMVRLLTSVIRPTDRVCRIGGDEFAVVFHEPEGPRQEGSKHPADVFQIARRFQEQVSRHRFPRLADRAAGTLTISGGLATFPWDGATPEQLLRRADELSLQSKRQGKNFITLGPDAPAV